MLARRIEFSTALLTFPLGMAALMYSLYGPVGLLEDGIDQAIVVVLAAAAALILTTTVAGTIDSWHDSKWARRALWCASVILLFGAAAMIITIGWLFLPAGILAISAAFLSWRMDD
jgi:tetrahydromethanopterin S-methyltransferase subunit D